MTCESYEDLITKLIIPGNTSEQLRSCAREHIKLLLYQLCRRFAYLSMSYARGNGCAKYPPDPKCPPIHCIAATYPAISIGETKLETWRIQRCWELSLDTATKHTGSVNPHLVY